MCAFADVKDEKTLNEWLHEIVFVTSTMSDPDEPQSFQEAWWDPDLQEDVGHGCVETCEKKRLSLSKRHSSDPDEQMVRQMCLLGVCSYVLVMLEVDNLAWN